MATIAAKARKICVPTNSGRRTQQLVVKGTGQVPGASELERRKDGRRATGSDKLFLARKASVKLSGQNGNENANLCGATLNRRGENGRHSLVGGRSACAHCRARGLRHPFARAVDAQLLSEHVGEGGLDPVLMVSPRAWLCQPRSGTVVSQSA